MSCATHPLSIARIVPKFQHIVKTPVNSAFLAFFYSMAAGIPNRFVTFAKAKSATKRYASGSAP